MRKIITLFLITLFWAFSLSIGIAVGSDNFGKVASVKGDVSVIRASAPQKAVAGMSLEKDDTIKTGADSSVTVSFDAGITGTVASDTEMALNELYLNSKVNALKKNIQQPAEDATPAKINVDTIGGTRGTEEVEKKSQDLKNEHYWDEEVK